MSLWHWLQGVGDVPGPFSVGVEAAGSRPAPGDQPMISLRSLDSLPGRSILRTVFNL